MILRIADTVSGRPWANEQLVRREWDDKWLANITAHRTARRASTDAQSLQGKGMHETLGDAAPTRRCA